MTIFVCLICFSIYPKIQGFVHECVFFLRFMQKFKMGVKNGRKMTFGRRLCKYHAGQKISSKLILHHFRDLSACAFYAEIQDGRQTCRGKHFLEKVIGKLCSYPAGQKFRRNCSISHSFRDKCVFVFYAEIQNDAKNGRKTIFQ